MLNVFHHILYLFVALINTNSFCIHAQITVSFYISYFVNFLLSVTVWQVFFNNLRSLSVNSQLLVTCRTLFLKFRHLFRSFDDKIILQKWKLYRLKPSCIARYTVHSHPISVDVVDLSWGVPRREGNSCVHAKAVRCMDRVYGDYMYSIYRLLLLGQHYQYVQACYETLSKQHALPIPYLRRENLKSNYKYLCLIELRT